ncbi:MAG TPA: energy transducer TonB [Rhodanobacter sp.]|nr:energy transducer TonB [Rhodanobacter sp.]
MFRLRTTTSLSLLALAVGIAGTQWLSGQGVGWAGPSERVAGFVHAVPPAVRTTHGVRQGHAARHVAGSPRAVAVVVPVRHRAPLAVAEAAAAEPAPPPELVPVAMPSDPVSWSRMRDHLAGNVLLQLAVDGAGNVTAASLAQSSGDPVLDAHALATVRHWRFAVPADHPDGLSGELTMRFAPAAGPLVQAP